MSLRNARVRKILAASGAQVDGGVAPASVFALRYQSGDASLAPTASGATYRQIFQVPFVGRCLVRAVYETLQTTPAARTASFAAGRSVAEDNPLLADGAAAPWTVADAVTPPAGAAGVYAWGRVKTAAALLDVPAPTDGGRGGYIYVNTLFAAAGDALVGNASRPLTDWQQYINPRLTGLKYRQYRADGDYTTTAQGAMPPPAALNHVHAVAWLEVTPLERVYWGLNIGDSTSQGLGMGTPLVQPNNYNWAHIAANMRIAAGRPVHISNFAHESAAASTYLGTPGVSGRLSAVLADTTYKPSFVVLQPISRNGSGLTDAVATASLTNAINWCARLARDGITPILRTLHGNGSGGSADDTRRQQINNAIRASGYPVFDVAAIVDDPAAPGSIRPEYRLDGNHFNAVGNEVLGAAFAEMLARIGV